MDRDQKRQYNQRIRRELLPLAKFLKDVAGLPQVLIDFIIKQVLREILLVVPLRNLQLTLTSSLQQFALNPLDTVSPYRSYNRYAYDPPFRTRGPIIRRLGYGSFQ